MDNKVERAKWEFINTNYSQDRVREIYNNMIHTSFELNFPEYDQEYNEARLSDLWTYLCQIIYYRSESDDDNYVSARIMAAFMHDRISEKYTDTSIQDYFMQSIIHKQTTYSALTLCESPVEAQFYAHYDNALISTDFSQYDGYGGEAVIEPQVQIDKYRVDFAAYDAIHIIEIDGHNYHKSKEDRTRDAERDRYLTSIGKKVIRFTGSEVYKNPDKCAEETIKIIMSSFKCITMEGMNSGEKA